MPRVPTYDSFQVDTGAAPNARVATSQPFQPDAGFQPVQPAQIETPRGVAVSAELMSVSSNQTEALGKAISSAGSVVGRIALDLQNQANQVRVDDALNQAKEAALQLQFDKNIGFMNARGKDALDRASGKPLSIEYADSLKDRINSIGDTLGNDDQKRLFSMHANNLVTQFEGSAMQHESSQFRDYALSVREGTIANQMNSIGLNYNNPELIDQSIKSIQAATWQQGQILGKSAEWVEAQTRKMTSNAHKVALGTALENNDVGYANAYLNKYKSQMDADDILRVQGLITKDVDARVALGVANGVMGRILPQVNVSEPDRAFNAMLKVAPGVAGDGAGPMAPIDNARVSSPFGHRNDPMSKLPSSHEGTDYAAPEGTPIKSSYGGKVIKVASEPNGYGNHVVIDHGDGYTSTYAHASTTNVRVGDEIQSGQVIGAVGNTGKSTGAHLHFEVRKDGKPIDSHEFTSPNAMAKQRFMSDLKKYDYDMTKTYAAQIVGEEKLSAAIDQAKQAGNEQGWLSYVPAEDAQKVKAAVSEFNAGGGTPKKPSLLEVHNQVRQTFGPNANPKQLRAALDESTRQYEDMSKAIKDQQEQGEADALQWLVGNGGRMAEMPIAIRAKIPATKFVEVQNHAQKIALGIPVETNMGVYNALIADPTSLAKITDAQWTTYMKDLSLGDFKSLSDIRAKYKTGEASGPGDVDVSAVNQALNERLRMLKIDPTPKDDGSNEAARVGSIRKAVIDQIIVTQKESGKKLSDAEISRKIDELFAKTDIVHNFWTPNSSGRVMSMKIDDISSETKKALKAAYAAKGIADPTDAEIMDAYFKLKVAGK